MTSPSTNDGLRRTTGALFVIGALTFAAAATTLSSTFDWPDIPREPADVVLPAFVDGGTSLVWTWFATAWTYAVLIVPILLLPAVLGQRGDPALRVATYVGATSVVLALIGFLRWVFVVPPLADSYVTGALSTVVPGFPVWDLGGLIGSSGWGLWVAALGVALLLRPVRRGIPGPEKTRDTASASPPIPRPAAAVDRS
jgi:Domain of unknown function (DUF4386)